jgi:hypothetical protein
MTTGQTYQQFVDGYACNGQIVAADITQTG